MLDNRSVWQQMTKIMLNQQKYILCKYFIFYYFVALLAKIKWGGNYDIHKKI